MAKITMPYVNTCDKGETFVNFPLACMLPCHEEYEMTVLKTTTNIIRNITLS